MFDLSKKEFKILHNLKTPQKIQNFLDTIPFNYEKKGDTCMSPVMVLKTGKAHCLEGALFAATALLLHGKKPLVMSLKVVKGDDDHTVALFQKNGFWGAISKTNHSVLRYRDPVYKSPRELAMSYFHEYYLSNGKKTLIGYSNPINLKKFGTKWITSKEDLWYIAESIFDSKHILTVPKKNKKEIRNAIEFEIKCTDPIEWKKSDKRT
jgi:hypothetical protein